MSKTNQWIYEPTTTYHMEYENNPPPLTQYGWVCPKCGSVWAPWQQQCMLCGNNTTWTMTANGTKVEVTNERRKTDQ